MKMQVDKDWLKRQINDNPDDENCEAGGLNLQAANRNAAKDYDMDIKDVRRIRVMYPDEFYEKMEEFIKERANQD